MSVVRFFHFTSPVTSCKSSKRASWNSAMRRFQVDCTFPWPGLFEDFREEIKKELSDVGIDEWTYLDNFFKRFNKAREGAVRV